jgi:methanogenic corrinoid protein MtbC1
MMIDYKALICCIENLDGDKIVEIIDDFVASNPTRDEGIDVMKVCQMGTEKVGVLYERGEYFVSDLLVAGALLEEIKEKLQPIIGEDIRNFKSGRITLGSVFGDVPEPGEIVLAKIVQLAGFTVIKSRAKVS